MKVMAVTAADDAAVTNARENDQILANCAFVRHGKGVTFTGKGVILHDHVRKRSPPGRLNPDGYPDDG